MLSTLALCATVGGTLAQPPNIVMLFVDDLGWMDLACQGSDFYETPNIDRLARQGVRFTQAYASAPVCSPTRAALMTGKTPARLHITDWLPGRRYPKQKHLIPDFAQRLPQEETTIAEALRERGYATFHVGKWHLGGRGSWPTDHGFDVNIGGGVAGQPTTYFHPYGTDRNDYNRVRSLPPGGREGEYLTDRLTDEALRLVGASRDRPFFLYFPYFNVHGPWEGKPSVVHRFQDKQKGQYQKNATYAAMVSAVDDSVGRILRELDRLGIAQNTLVVFTSDNGGVHSISPQTPLRMGKGYLYEGGIREPLIVRWPGVAPEGAACKTPVATIDFLPTLLEAAGARVPKGIDGKSFVPALRKPGGRAPDRALTWHYPHYHTVGRYPASAIRIGRWKLIEWLDDGRVELFDLQTDLGEERDLSKEQPGRVQSMLDRLHMELRRQGAQPMRPNPDHDPEKPWADAFTPIEDDGGAPL